MSIFSGFSRLGRFELHVDRVKVIQDELTPLGSLEDRNLGRRGLVGDRRSLVRLTKDICVCMCVCK